jgi:hypothetical protein
VNPLGLTGMMHSHLVELCSYGPVMETAYPMAPKKDLGGPPYACLLRNRVTIRQLFFDNATRRHKDY